MSSTEQSDVGAKRRLEKLKLSWTEQARHLNIHAWKDIEFLLSRVEAAETELQEERRRGAKLAEALREMAKWCVRQSESDPCFCIPHQALKDWESGKSGENHDL